ncbi:MAG: beta-ketoacyl-[acyl-carrier-protein] synthase family protein [Lentisphaerae bacterium]|nr:beta-ketoacyl-[acyl-carrier-protein] synthase family protein [Lentisphaerota bacterium]
MNSRPRAVITGLGILAANGIGHEQFWKSLLANTSGIGPITLFDSHDLACHIAGEVRNFHIEDFVPPELKPRRMGRFTQLAVAAARLAVADASLDIPQLQARRSIPVALGVSTSAMDMIAEEPRIHTAVTSVPNAATSAIGYLFHAQPKLLTLSVGCASSLEAIATGAQMIQSGEADLLIAGGADAAVTHYVFDCMLKCRKCSTRNDDPTGASRPFDRDRDYGVLGEGAAIVIMENLESARARGVRPYAEVVSSYSASDPAPAAEGAGLEQTMHMSMANAGCGPKDIQLVSAHGPSDIHMDLLETNLIKRTFGAQAYRCPVTSIKGATGCPMGAGGAMQAVAACLSIRHQSIPPTTNFVEGSEGCDLDYVPRECRLTRVERVLVNSHGFGRSNCSMILAGV